MLKAGRGRCGSSKREVSVINSIFRDHMRARLSASLPAPQNGESRSHGYVNPRGQVECSQRLPGCSCLFLYIRTEASPTVEYLRSLHSFAFSESHPCPALPPWELPSRNPGHSSQLLGPAHPLSPWPGRNSAQPPCRNGLGNKDDVWKNKTCQPRVKSSVRILPAILVEGMFIYPARMRN